MNNIQNADYQVLIIKKKNIMEGENMMNHSDGPFQSFEELRSSKIASSEIGQGNIDDCYQSQYVDNLLETSFVQFQRTESKKEQTNTDCNTGSSFFKRTNQLYFSDIAKKDKIVRIKNKKVQCDIGCGGSILEESPSTVLAKAQRLEILKMIKLLKVLFKQLRSEKKSIQEVVKWEKIKFNESVAQMGFFWQQKLSEFQNSLEEKEQLIKNLEEEVALVVDDNQRLRKRLEELLNENSKKVRFVEDDNWKSLTEIMQEVSTSKAKIEHLEDKLEQKQNESYSFNMEVSHLSDAVETREVELKKLEYQNKMLKNENEELSQKLQQILQKYAEAEARLDEDGLIIEDKSQQLNQVIRLNEFYQEEIEKCKSQIKKLSEEQDGLKFNSESVLMSQLNKYQECFNEEYVKMKKEFNQLIFDKNNQINELLFKEKVYLSVIAEKNQVNLKQGSNIFRESRDDDTKISDSRSEDLIPSKNSGRSINTYTAKSRENIDSKLSIQNKDFSQKQNKAFLPNKNKPASKRPLTYQDKRQKVQQLIMKAQSHQIGGIHLINRIKNDSELSFSASDGMKEARNYQISAKKQSKARPLKFDRIFQ